MRKSSSRHAADDLAHPAFGKLFIETEYLPTSAALLCHRRPRDARETGQRGPCTSLSLEGRAQGAVEWETDRARFLGRGRSPARSRGARRPRVVRHDGHRARSDREPAAADPVAAGRVGAALVRDGMAPDRETAEALAQKYHDPSAASRTFALALTHVQSGLRHLGISTDEAVLFERLASRVLGTDGSLRAERRDDRANELGQPGLWPHGISGDLPILLVRVAAGDDAAPGPAGSAGAGVLAVEGAERRRRHPERAPGQLSRRNAGAAHGSARRRSVEHVEASARRRLPAARRSDGARGARPARNGRARDSPRRSRRSANPARSTAPGPRRSFLRLRRRSPDMSAVSDAAVADAALSAMTLSNGLGGFADDGRAYVLVLDGSRGNADAVDERHRQPAIRHHRSRRPVRRTRGRQTAARTG